MGYPHGLFAIQVKPPRVLHGREPLSCLVLYLSYTRLVLGERSPLGMAAALLARCPPSHYPKLGPAVRCRSSPEFPFRFICARL